MKSVLCGLVSLSFLLLDVTGQAKADYIFTTLDVPGSTGGTTAFGINTSGQIVGAYGDGGGQHGFLLSGGSYTTLDVPGSTATAATGINASDQIVGIYQAGSSRNHGFLL